MSGTANVRRMILCEGVEDAAFLQAMRDAGRIDAREIYPVDKIGTVGGISGFRSALELLPLSGRSRIPDRLILVADGDTHYNENFRCICDQIKQANADKNINWRYPVPDRPYTLKHGSPSIAIVLLPALQKKGCLETLLWGYVTSAKPALRACVDDACTAHGLLRNRSGWNQSQIDKARIRLVIALDHKRNPRLGISSMWREAPELFPIGHSTFSPLEEAFAAL